MTKKALPKVGDHVSAEKFHVSEMNVRAEKSFGDSDEDRALIANLRRGKIIGPFKARPEGEGFGVVVGRRRFLAKKQLDTKHFIVGSDCLIEEISDEEAREASLIENLEILRKEMDPMTRAKQLNEIVSSNPGGLRGASRHLGISPSTLSEWLKPLDLRPKMQKALSEGKLYFSNALQVTRLKLGEIAEDELATTLETEGLEEFQKQLDRLAEKRLKRGIPKGKYVFVKISWDKVHAPDMALYEKLEKLAEGKDMKLDEYCKWVLQEHVK